MNNLQMVQATWRLLGHEDDTILDVADNEGVKGDVIDAVNDAWLDIQRERASYWKFLRAVERFDMTAYKTHYAVGTDVITADSTRASRTVFGEWDKDMILYDGLPVSFRSYDYFRTHHVGDYYRLHFTSGSTEMAVGQTVTGDTSGSTGLVIETATLTSGTYAGGDAVGYVDLYEVSGAFDETTPDGLEVATVNVATLSSITEPSAGKPRFYTIDPSTDTLIFDWVDDDYTIEAHYYKTLDTLSGNTDVPTGLPTRYHMLIVYTALEDLGIKFGAREILDFYGRKRKHVLGQLLRAENPAKAVRLRPIVR